MTRKKFAFAATALLAPAVAFAHGGELLFMFLYLPPLLIAGAVLVLAASRRVGARRKVRVALPAIGVSAALFALNHAIQYGTVRFPFGNGTYLLFVLSQVVLPVAVLLVGVRRATRTPSGAPERPHS